MEVARILRDEVAVGLRVCLDVSGGERKASIGTGLVRTVAQTGGRLQKVTSSESGDRLLSRSSAETTQKTFIRWVRLHLTWLT